MKKFTQRISLPFLFASVPCFASTQPNPPTWPTSVYVYTTATPTATIQSDFNTVFATNGGQSPPDNGQFVNQGYAFLFAPGSYTSLQLNVGYYTSVIGMGSSPTDTTINSVNSPQGNNDSAIGALNSFWRSAENFQTTPALAWSGTSLIGMTWAVSQAAPLRKVNVNGSLYLFQLTSPSFASGYASGGFVADCSIAATTTTQNAVVMGSQQQFLMRNCDMTVPSGSAQSTVSDGVWNQVFVGCSGAPSSHCSNCPSGGIPPCSCVNCATSSCTTTCNGSPYTTVTTTPVIAEKPYITSNATATSFNLVVPQGETNKTGTSQDNSTPVTTVSFSSVLVATPSTPVSTINAEIAAGNHVILTPGTYTLTDTIQVNQANTVILGIGFPILISSTGLPCISVGSVNGVRIGGIILQAGPSTSPVTPALLQWGSSGGDSSITSGYLYDCFARTGRFSGSSTESFNQTELMVQINSSHVVCDNLWLWRADHDSQGTVTNGNNYCNTGIDIVGGHVTIYGLGNEHHIQDLLTWSGDHGACYFYQAEFPYDVGSGYGTSGYVGYRVASAVNNHIGVGVGIYSNFVSSTITVNDAISAPSGTGISFTNSLTRYLNNNGGIASVLNGLGNNTTQANSPSVTASYPGPAYLCDFSGSGTNFKQKQKRKYNQ